MSDRYGHKKFREFDKRGHQKPIEELDDRPMSNASRHDMLNNFESSFEELTPAHVREKRKQIVPPAKKFAHGLVQKYMRTAPINFQVQRPPKVIDFTMPINGGPEHEKKL